MNLTRTVACAASAAIVLASASVASAGVVFTDNFDTDNGGVSALNYAGWTNWNVNRKVDLLHTGDGFGTTGSGGYVDLDGDGNPGGEFFTKQVFTYAAGDEVVIEFDLSGNQRVATTDNMYFGLFDQNPLGNTRINAVQKIGTFVFSPPNASGQILGSGVNNLAQSTGFFHNSLTFNVVNAGSGVIYFGTNTSTDGNGALIDNVKVSINAVPEPATWALMIGGFGIVGATLRRRKAVVA